MAIQLPNPGLGDGQTGDNEYVMWTKVKNNFNNNNHAASKLVGGERNNVPIYSPFGLSGLGYGGRAGGAPSGADLDNITPNIMDSVSDTPAGLVGLPCGFYYFPLSAIGGASGTFGIHCAFGSNNDTGFRILNSYYTNKFYLQSGNKDGTPWSARVEIYHSGNTTTDSNGFVKKASPIVRLFSDKIEMNSEAEQQNIEFVKNGIGDYTIKNTSGLSTDGWHIELPNDANGNAKFAVIYDDTPDGTINIKTYKRKFDFELVAIVADTDNPVDITDGRWVDLRLNELPQEPMPQEA